MGNANDGIWLNSMAYTPSRRGFVIGSATASIGLLSLPLRSGAAVVGAFVPAQALTEARIAALPGARRAAWTRYFAVSADLHAADVDALRRERVSIAVVPPPPADGPSGGGGMALDRLADWYAGDEARRVAQNIVSFQTPAGGWGKNQDRTGPPRLCGQSWVTGELPTTGEADESWSYVGTIDNNATIDEIRFLAAVQAHLSGDLQLAARAAIGKGVRYLLQAQMPNGGFPQVFPLQGGYHDAVTFNDDAMVNVGRLLRDIGAGREGFDILEPSIRDAATSAYDRLLSLIIATQVRIDGQATIWAQQYDALTLEPVGARRYESRALATGESAGALRFLMEETARSEALVAAVLGGIGWLQAHALHDVEWTRPAGEAAKRLVARPGARPLWPRFIALDGSRAIFGDRSGTIHDDVGDLEPERRNGYAWYVTTPAAAVEMYRQWVRAG